MDIKEITDKALQVLKDGGVILYPTDTVWGIGCDATNEDAVRKVYEIKKRSDSKSLVLLASDMNMVAMHVEQIPPMAIDLVEVNDAPMTIIYPKGIRLAPNTLAEDGSVGIRIPLNDFCVNLVKRFGRPLVSTSANISGESTPKKFKDIPADILDAMDYVVPSFLEQYSTGKSSQIIKVEMNGQVKIIRA